MSEFQMTRKTVKIKDYDGNDILLQKCKYHKAREYMASLMDLQNDPAGSADKEIEILVEAGMPRGLAHELDAEDMSEILQLIVGKKK